jgi:hypothetical protein
LVHPIRAFPISFLHLFLQYATLFTDSERSKFLHLICLSIKPQWSGCWNGRLNGRTIISLVFSYLSSFPAYSGASVIISSNCCKLCNDGRKPQ